MIKKIYLFRHGETDWNKIGKLQYHTDIDLNETGILQAKINANALKDKGIQHIYSSPLKRAYKTGKILADLINVNIEIVDNLKEVNGGLWSGKTKTEVKELLGKDNYEKFFHSRNEMLNFRFPDGETKLEARNRIYNCIIDICKNTPYNTIGISSHGFVLTEFTRATNYKDDDTLKNCEYIEAEFDSDTQKIKILKRVECNI